MSCFKNFFCSEDTIFWLVIIAVIILLCNDNDCGCRSNKPCY